VWSYAVILPYAFMTWCLIKQRDKLTSTLRIQDKYRIKIKITVLD